MARPALKGGSVAARPSRTASSAKDHVELLRDAELQVLRLVESNPKISQREIAETLNLSLGKANYCIRALIDLGWLKVRNFKNSANKLGYAYALTPSGLKHRAGATMIFLERKRAEYEALRAEIASLEQELSTWRNPSDP